MPEPQNHSSPPNGMPETRITRWAQPFVRFFQIQSASGFILLACTAVALLLANSPWSASFAEIWQIRLRISVGQFELDKPLLLWLNDGLTDISWVALGLAAVGFGVTYIFNRIGVRQVSIYVVIGAGIWLAFLKSGVHPTVAGVLLGFLTPSKAWVGTPGFPNVLTNVLNRLVKSSDESTLKQRPQALGELATTAREGTSPLERLEIGLHPWVAFLIMPLFALANAGVSIEVARLGSPVAIAVAAGLVLGKPIGIVLFSWIATKLGFARLPAEVNWKIMLGAGCLAGIGFTMSIFISGLALQGDLLDDGKFGALVGSMISAILGCVLLLMFMPKRPEAPVGAPEQKVGNKEIPGAQVSEENAQAQCDDRLRDDGGDNQR